MISVGGMRSFFNRFGNGCALLLLGVFALSLVIGYGSNGFGNRASHDGAAPVDTVIATVNGDPITEADFREMNARLQSENGVAAQGKPFADRQGETMQRIIYTAIVNQEAKRRNAHPLEADIDKQVDGMRESLGRNLNKSKLSDQEFADYLMTKRNMSVADFRQLVAKSMVGMALFNVLKADEKITDTEARNQNSQLHLIIVNVPFQDAAMPVLQKLKTKPLTEAEAKQKAEALYARVKGGADIILVAKSNTDDPEGAKTGGDVPTIPEYPVPKPRQMPYSINVYGSEVADTVHKLTPGQISGVLKITGMRNGYAFLKLVDRKVDTPKDFDPKKAIAAMKEQRANEKIDKLIKSLTKSAKIDIKDLDKKAYYDSKQLETAQMEVFQNMFSGIRSVPVNKAETDAQQTIINKEFDDMLKRHPDDTTAAIIVADNIKQHRPMGPGDQNRLIALNETIAKSTDDYDRHFQLADLYREKKQYDKAKGHLDRIAKLMSYNTLYDLEGYKAADETHRKLETAYRSINETAAADKEKAQSDALQIKIGMENIKLKEEERKARAAQKAGTGGAMSIPGINIPAGGSSQPITITPTPSGGASAPAVPSNPSNSNSSKKSSPTSESGTKTVPPLSGAGR